MLLPELAEKIVKEVRKLIGEDIIVVDTEGNIMSSTDHARVGAFHEGALIASNEKRTLIITLEDQQKLKGVKAGINLPIFFQNDVIGILGITGEPQKVNPFGEIIRKMTELLISENHYAEQFDQQSRARETFVMDWIQSKEWDHTFLNRARVLSVDLKLNRMVAIIEFEKLNPIISRDAWSSIIKWFHHNRNDLTVRWGNERIVVIFDYTKKPTKEFIGKRLTHFILFLKNQIGLLAYAGVGQGVDAHELRNTFRQAERALKVAKQKNKIVFDEDLTLEMILGELTSKTSSDFIARTIGPLLSEKELLDTLKELFRQNHSLKKTADHLHIHINTLHYRLKKIEEFTQLNSSNIHDLLVLYIATLLLDEHTKNNL